MKTITFIGAGSLGFTRELVRDILTFPRLADAEIRLMDIDAERLEFSRRAGASPRVMGYRGEKGKYDYSVRVSFRTGSLSLQSRRSSGLTSKATNVCSARFPG